MNFSGLFVRGQLLFIFLLFLLYKPESVFADNPGPVGCIKDSVPFVVVREIRFDGNKHTKRQVLAREMDMAEKDTVPLPDLFPRMRKSRENIFNTRLFNFVTVDTFHVAGEPCTVDIHVHVIERWYIWPWPYFEFSDRNFNTWLETMDWSRLTYGINLTVMNVRGRNETLVFPIHLGFNEKYGFIYTIPFVNRQQSVGISAGADYERNHEVIVGSEDNKTVYYKDPSNYPLQLFYGFGEVRLRPGFYSMNYFRLSYSAYLLSDSLVSLNYGIGDLNRIKFLSVFYQYRNDRRDEHFYPLSGSYFDISGTYNGVFSDYLTVIYFESSYRKYWHIFNRWYVASGLFAKYSFAMEQPYFLQQGLGYGRTFVRGYEYYVVDGQHYLLWKNNLKFALLPKRVLKMGFLKSQKFNTVPYAFYLNVFTDLGYVYNRDAYSNELNSLQNSLLIGYGAGIDFTTYYDIVVRLEFSMNGMGKPGIYLHFMAPI
jgi:outer membrane protein assembly factor BamA